MRCYAVLARVGRAPDAQVPRLTALKGGQTGGMWAISKDYDSIGGYGQTETQEEPPSCPDEP